MFPGGSFTTTPPSWRTLSSRTTCAPCSSLARTALVFAKRRCPRLCPRRTAATCARTPWATTREAFLISLRALRNSVINRKIHPMIFHGDRHDNQNQEISNIEIQFCSVSIDVDLTNQFCVLLKTVCQYVRVRITWNKYFYTFTDLWNPVHVIQVYQRMIYEIHVYYNSRCDISLSFPFDTRLHYQDLNILINNFTGR